MPDWVEAGYKEYAARMPQECRLELREVAMAKRARGDSPARMMLEEASRLEAAIPAGALRIALEVGGREWTTEQLSAELGGWMMDGRDVALLVGGPDGLDPRLSASCDHKWSLSKLTMPHPLVRVVLAEQIYRAWSLLRGHPYHRG